MNSTYNFCKKKYVEEKNAIYLQTKVATFDTKTGNVIIDFV